MKKIVIAAACAALLSGAAFAQSSQPQGGANQSPTSPTSDTSKDSMKKGTTGMSSGKTHKDQMRPESVSKGMQKNDMKDNTSR